VAAFVPLERHEIARPLGLIDLDTGEARTVQVDQRGRLCWWEGALDEGQVRHYQFRGVGDIDNTARVTVREFNNDRVDVLQSDHLIASYHCGADLVRPHLFPLTAPSGRGITHDPHGTIDPYPHQRSCWAGWGDVDGVDHWSDTGAHGFQRHRRFAANVSGPVFGRIASVIEWLDHEERRQFVEVRAYTFYVAHGGSPIVDVVMRFTMNETDIVFGDTAHGGLCAVRVAGPISVDGGGSIRNAEGLTNEAGCWGHASNWCDYRGTIDGRPIGITLMDCPHNVRHPTHWNVRDYGLMAASPFGLSEFLHNKRIHGDRTWAHGDAMRLRYRLVLHDDALAVEDIQGHYSTMGRPVRVEIESAVGSLT
jgi:hypothetical protein